MRLLTRGLLLIFFLLILFALFIVVFEYWENKEAEHLISELELKDKIILESQLKLRNEPVSRFLHDLTLYDDSVDFINSRNVKFVTDNINLSSEVYNIGEIWIYTPGFKKIYYFKNKNISIAAGEIESLLPLLKIRFNSEKFFSFHYRKENTVYHIIAASIHPSSDRERKTKPAGYIITAVPYDTAFLNEIKLGYPLVKDIEIDFTNGNPRRFSNLLSVHLPLPDISGNPVAYININPDSLYIHDIRKADVNQRYFIYIIIVAGSIIIIGFIHGVVRPLKEIYRALFENNYMAPKSQKYYSFEFKRIMDMININRNVEMKLGKALEENEKQMETAQKAIKAKSEFIANISHEIRTPMTGVIGFSDMLLETTLDTQQQYFAEGIKKSSGQILNIINDILDLSKIEVGKFELSNKPFNISEMLNDVIFILQGYAIDKGIKIVLDNSLSGSVSVEGDEKRLRQILLNLGGNAIKFTLHGEVIIAATSVIVDENMIELTFEVKDSGIGMTDEQVSRIFDKYEQVHDPVAFTGGSGLGLAITKSLTELMNGTLKVESTPGSGSTFTVVLEMVLLKDKIEKPSLVQVKDLKFDILIAEDNLINTRVLENILKKTGCSCDCCDNGQKAVQMSEQKKYDLILMDFQMPVLDGMEAALKIRSGGGPNKSTMIYAISADMAEDSRLKSGKSRMNGFILKPFVR